jgi:hypothetical protein
MSIAIGVTIVSGLLIPIVGSRKSVPANVFVAVFLGLAIALATARVCEAIGITTEAWQGPVFAIVGLVYALSMLSYCAQIHPPIGWVDVQWLLSDRRRRSSIRTDVRRMVKRYKIEVEHA